MKIIRFIQAATLTIGASLGAAAPATSGAIFIKIPNVSGPVTRQGFTGSIELTAYSQSFTNSVNTSIGSGSGAGKVSCGTINISKAVDATSPDFLEYVTRGTLVKTIDVYFTGNNPNTSAATARYRIVLSNVRVTSLTQGDTAGNGNGLGITENLSLVAEKFQIIYVTQNAEGANGNAETYAWDCATNSAA